MRKDIQKHIQAYQQCGMVKSAPRLRREPVKFPASEKFEVLHLDLVGPLPPSHNGNTYIFTMMDRYTSFVEAIPMLRITSDACVEALLKNWIAKFGLPSTIITDQGRQFESHIFSKICMYFDIDKRRTTPYHPQTNGNGDAQNT